MSSNCTQYPRPRYRERRLEDERVVLRNPSEGCSNGFLRMADFLGPSEGRAWRLREMAVAVAVGRGPKKVTKEPGRRQAMVGVTHSACDSFVVVVAVVRLVRDHRVGTA